MNDSVTKSQMFKTIPYIIHEIIPINKANTTNPPRREATDTMSQPWQEPEVLNWGSKSDIFFIYGFTAQIFGKLGKAHILFLPTK